MPALSPKRFRTLAEANEYFAKGASRSEVAQPLPKPRPDPKKNPIDPSVAPPAPTPPGVPAMGSMSRAGFDDFLSRRTDSELLALLGHETSKVGPEQDAGIIAKLYREIRKRRKF